MSEHDRRIRRIAVGFAVIAMLTALLAVVIVVARRADHAQQEPRSPASRHVSARDVVSLAAETVEQAGEGIHVIDGALGKALGLSREDTIIAISGRRVTDVAQLRAMLRDLGALAPGSLFVDLIRDRQPVLERWELDGDLAAAWRASAGAGNGGGRRLHSASPPLDPLITTVAQLDNTTYQVPRSTLEAWLANPRRVTIGAGTFSASGRGGFEIFAIRPGSVLEALGIQNGDVIRGINGSELGSTDKVIELIAKSTQRITVDLQRQGQTIILNYLIK